jgi:hypothetical protein
LRGRRADEGKPSRERRRLGVLSVARDDGGDDSRECEDRQPFPAEGFDDENWDEESVFGYFPYALPIVENGEHQRDF